jgi:CRP-like cAMP-binding protein
MQLVEILNSLKSKAFPTIKQKQILPGFDTKISKSMIFSKKVIDDLNISHSSGFSMTRVDDDSNNSTQLENPDPQMIKLQEKLGKKLGKINKKQIDPGQKLESKYVTEEELKLLEDEFPKPPSHKNYLKIDEILKKLYFFHQFPLETRQMIYSISTIQTFSAGSYVFLQGEVGDALYVVVKGAISVEKTLPEYGNKKIVVMTLYDGRQFGEIAGLNAMDSETFSNQRSASCVASEQTTVLSVPRDTLSRLILCKNKEELEEKMNFLVKTLLFKGFSKKSLLPLALNLDKTCFKLNDIVLHQGELPKGLYLVMKGFLDVEAEENIVKNEKDLEFSPRRSRIRTKSPMYFTRDPPERPKTQSKSPLMSISQSDISLKNKARPLSRVSKEKMTVGSIKEFDFFGARIFKKQFSKKQVSKFSVLVQSSKAEILIFTSYHLQFLNQNMHTQFMTIVEKNDDLDCPSNVDSKKFKKLFHNWHHYKSQLMSEIQKDSFLERKKKLFPYDI